MLRAPRSAKALAVKPSGAHSSAAVGKEKSSGMMPATV